MYEKTGNIIKLARENNTSVIAFICMDYVMARTVVYAAEATKTPAVVMLYPEHVTVQKTTGFRNYAAMVKELADEVSVPIGLHCDHDYTYDAIIHTIECGFESVMMDGSMNDLDTNIALTKKVVDRAHELGAIVGKTCSPSRMPLRNSARRPVWILWLFPSGTLTENTRKRRIWISPAWRTSAARLTCRSFCTAEAVFPMTSF